MAKVSNSKAQTQLFEVEQAVQHTNIAPQKKRVKGIYIEEHSREQTDKIGLLGCKDFGEYIREIRSNKTII